MVALRSALPLLVALLAGCGVGLEYSAHTTGDSAVDPVGAHEDTADADDTAAEDTAPDDTGDPPEDTDTGPRIAPPEPGELVISEALFDPAAVDDGNGEWIEVVNVSDHTLDLGDLWLGDDGVDGVALDAGFTLPAGDYAVLCANGDAAQNGGVTCDGSYRYKSTGGGLALANTGDELVLSRSSGGDVVDRFAWGASFVSAGVAMGVRPGRLTAEANDPESAWCEQTARLSGGDHGTPGRENGC